MKLTMRLFLAGLALIALQAQAAELTCEALKTDYEMTQAAEQLAAAPDLFAACEEVVERDGAPFIKVKAVVRRAGRDTTRLYIPATDRTVEVTPDPDLRVLIGNRKVRPSRLERGQEIRIYLSVDEFTRPAVEEVAQVAMVTETEEIMPVAAAPVAALPTTASPLPTLALIGGLLLLGGLIVRRLRTA